MTAIPTWVTALIEVEFVAVGVGGQRAPSEPCAS